MEGAVGTLYEGEKFQLLFKFTPKYPFDSPEVRFGTFLNIRIVSLKFFFNKVY